MKSPQEVGALGLESALIVNRDSLLFRIIRAEEILRKLFLTPEKHVWLEWGGKHRVPGRAKEATEGSFVGMALRGRRPGGGARSAGGGGEVSVAGPGG